MEELNFIIDNNSSLKSECHRLNSIWQCQWIKDKSSCTTAPHGNRKVLIELTIFLKTITLRHFPAKYHGSCTFRCLFWSWLLKKIIFSRMYFCLMYICIHLFWWNYIHALFFFWYILLLYPACLKLMLWESDGKSHAFFME